MTDPRPGASGPPEVLERRERPKLDPALRAGLLVSAVLHVLFVVLYPFFTSPAVPGVIIADVVPGEPEPAGIQVIQVVEVDEESVSEPRPDAVETPEVEVEDAPGPAGPEIVPELPGPRADDRRRAAEVLAPQAEDSVIWREVDPELTDLTDLEEARLRLRWAAAEWNAARDAEARAAADALDWTHTDADGNRWGVSPGKIHLGKVTLPLPFGFGTPQGRSDELDRRLWETDEIDRAAARGAALQTQKERARAIREREDEKRRKERGEKADTTGVARDHDR